MDRTISTSRGLRGTVSVPGDKSISHRSVMLGALADGECVIDGFLRAADPISTLACFGRLGVRHRFDGERLIVSGNGLHGLRAPDGELDAGNSGTTIRLMAGILSGQPFTTVVSGDQYLVKRPMRRIMEPLGRMGARIASSAAGTAPLTIDGRAPLTAVEYELPVASAQVKSAVLLAGLFADGTTTVVESEPSRDHTERMLRLPVEERSGRRYISVTGGTRIPAQPFLVPGDPSSAAFFAVAAAIVPGSQVLIRNVGMNPSRTGYLDVLTKMKARIAVENERTVGGEPVADLVVSSSELRSDIVVEGELIPNLIDEIPVLAVAAAFADGSFTVKGAGDLRNKETDRIAAVCSNLRRMGVDVEERPDGFAFESKKRLFSSDFDSFDDHRIAMAFGIASLALDGASTIKDAACVSISFPNFWDDVASLQR